MQRVNGFVPDQRSQQPDPPTLNGLQESEEWQE
jgi:hypothetical protein